jgi:Restriction endonuclease
MIDFSELPSDGRAFEQLIREILLVMGLHPQWTGQGADQGRDIVATEILEGPLGTIEQKWLVQCKHFAHSGNSVGRDDVGSFDSDCRQISANGYLLAVSTQPSSGLVTKLKELADQSQTHLRIKIWDAVDIEKLLAEPRLFSLGHLFFPQSFAQTPWKLYNSGSPNRWTAHYKSYFLVLSNRISGSHPSLRVCEDIVSRLESVAVGPKEQIRPRAVFYDDKNDSFTVFADYLVPDDKEPTRRPSDFETILKDGYGFYSDGEGASWYPTDWDIRMCKVPLMSDHFDKDQYYYYDPFVSTYNLGSKRGPSIGELAQYFDHWHS